MDTIFEIDEKEFFVKKEQKNEDVIINIEKFYFNHISFKNIRLNIYNYHYDIKNGTFDYECIEQKIIKSLNNYRFDEYMKNIGIYKNKHINYKVINGKLTATNIGVFERKKFDNFLIKRNNLLKQLKFITNVKK